MVISTLQMSNRGSEVLSDLAKITNLVDKCLNSNPVHSDLDLYS